MKRKMIVSFILTVLFFASVFSVTIHSGAVASHSGSGFLGAQSTPDPIDEWPMFHHDLTHTGYSTSPAPTTNQTLWNYTTGASVQSSPAVAGGVVYVGSLDTYVYALNATTGALIWSYTTVLSVYSSPAVVGGVVYVGSQYNNVYALNATTGALIWSYTTGSSPVWSSPAVAGGVVYVGSGDHNVYALNATTGAPIWNYTTGTNVLSSPAVACGMVFVGSDDGRVYALNASTGILVWNYTTGGYVYSSPAVAGGVVFVGSADTYVYALNATTGALIWSYTTGNSVQSSPAVTGGIVYIGSDDFKVYAFGPIHDVAVTGVASSKTVVCQGFSAFINVTVANQGDFTETFNVTAYANTTSTGTQVVTALPSGNSAQLVFMWNTTGFAYGNYTLSAYAWPVPSETNTRITTSHTAGWPYLDLET